MINQIINH